VALITNNISGSGNPDSRIGITGSLVVGDTSAFNNLVIGTDTVFYVSGTRSGRNSTGTSVFGGDLIISGAVAAQDGIGGFSPIKLNTDVGLTGSLRLTKQDPVPGSSSDEIVIFASGTGGVTKLYYGAGGTSNEVATAGGGAVGGTGQIQFSNGSGGFSASSNLVWDSVLNGGTLKASNLFITGTTTVVSSTNFVVTDPVVMIGSGALGTSQPSLLAFANGSKTTSDDLIIGASNGIVKVATYNTTGGLLPVGGLPGAFNTLADLQSNKVLIGVTGFAGVEAASAGNTLVLSGTSTGGIRLSNGNNQQVQLFSDATNYLNFRYDSGPNQVLLDGQSRKMLLSGSQVVLQTSGTAGNEGVAFIQTVGAVTSQHLTITSGSVGTNISALGSLNLNSGVTSGELNIASPAGSVRVQVKDATQSVVLQSGPAGNFLSISSGSIGAFNNVADILASVNKDLVIGTSTTGRRVILADTTTTSYASAFSGSIVGTTAVPNAAIIQSDASTALVLSGANTLVLGAGTSGGAAGYVAFVGTANGRAGFFPAQDRSTQEFDLGGPQKRWANIYTGDLHLRNDRGDYTLIEEENFLSIRFNKTGKRYKFLLEPVPELDEK
jgi:hypothetical protein